MRGQRKHFLPRVGSGIFKLELPPEQRREDSATLNRVEGGARQVSEIYEIVDVVARSRFTGSSSGREFNDREGGRAGPKMRD